jgi:hypothetical protein
MKTFFKLSSILISIFLINSCDQNDDDIFESNISNSELDGLKFMLEEEKLARDVYIFLENIWGLNQFSNIIDSEQSHINSVANVLNNNQISYSILPEGVFQNEDLQSLYNILTNQGTVSENEALKVGATIEDLDIIDLDNFISQTSNTTIISLYEKLQCGSRNHLRSFVKALEIRNDYYMPQYLSTDAYNEIISSTNENCN